MCSLIYPARKAHALYYIEICGLSDSTIFVHIILQKTQLKKSIEDETCVLNSSTNLSQTFFIPKKKKCSEILP